MSRATLEDVWKLLDDAAELPYGSARIALQEEAVRLADRLEDDEASYTARMEVVHSAVFSGFPEKVLVAFSWCVAKGDEKPDEFPESRVRAGFLFGLDILWAYKWVTMVARGFHQIPRPQLEATLEDMATRYRKHGYSLRPYWMERTRVLWEFGEEPGMMREAFETFQTSPRDAYSDCPACERNFEVHVHLWEEEWDRALLAAAPLLSGEESCAEVPHITYGAVLPALLELGEFERASTFHRRGYELIKDQRDHVTSIPDHVDYLVRIGELDEAFALFDRHLHWALDTLDPSRQLAYFRSGGPLFRALQGSRDNVALRHRDRLGVGDDSTSSAKLAQYFDRRATELARAFDQRNGNGTAVERLRKHDATVVPGNHASPPTSS